MIRQTRLPATNINKVEACRQLIDIGIALSTEKDINHLLERILTVAKTMVNADAGTLYLASAAGQLEAVIMFNNTLHISQARHRGDATTLLNIASRCTHIQKTIIINDIDQADHIDLSNVKRFDAMTGYTSKSLLMVPLRNFVDQVIGVLQLINAKDKVGSTIPFAIDCVPIIEALSSQASIALANRYLMDEQNTLHKQLESQLDKPTKTLRRALTKLAKTNILLKELATIDTPTGIKNRQYIDEALTQTWRQAERQGYPVTLMLIDIDHFKQVNDTYGHLVGDESLAEIAQLIDSSFQRPFDVVGRYGGDEFMVILPYVEAKNAFTKAEQVRRHIQASALKVDKHTLYVTISIGWASLTPSSSMMPRDMIAIADQAIYTAKSLGRNCIYPADVR